MKMYKLKEPVRIRFKELKDGNKSIYLDIYMKGRKREYIFLNLYLHPEQSKEDKEFLVGFIEFLNKDTRDFDKDTVRRVARPISSGYKVVLFARVMMVLNRAVRENIIMKSPGKEIYPRHKPRHMQKNRCYLTIEELQRIIQTPCLMKNDVKCRS